MPSKAVTNVIQGLLMIHQFREVNFSKLNFSEFLKINFFISWILGSRITV